MSLFRDDGIVLRTQKLGEADRIMLCFPGGCCNRLRLRRGLDPRLEPRGGPR